MLQIFCLNTDILTDLYLQVIHVTLNALDYKITQTPCHTKAMKRPSIYFTPRSK